MAPTKPRESMCVVDIGMHINLVMSTEKALSLIKLLQSGVALAECDFRSRRHCAYDYDVKPLPPVSLITINPDQLRHSAGPIPRAAALPAPTKEY